MSQPGRQRATPHASPANDDPLRLAIESANDAYVAIDDNSVITDWNRAAEYIFGWTREEILGARIDETIIPREFRDRHRQGLRRFLETGEGPVLYSPVELIGLHRSGRRFPLELTVWPVQIDGGYAFNAFVRDSTRRTRDALFLTLLREVAVAANEASTVSAALGIALRSVCDSTGWPLGNAYIVAPEGRPRLVPTGIWHPADDDTFRAFRDATDNTVLEPGEGLPGRVLLDGRPMWVADVPVDEHFVRRDVAREVGLRSGFAFPVVADSAVVAVLEFFDTTVSELDAELMDVMANGGAQLGRVVERARAQRDVQRATAELARSYRDLRDFAYAASHDLASPLTTIIGYLDLLQMDLPEDSDGAMFVDRAVKATEVMRAILQDLLQYAKVGSATRTVEEVDLAEVLDSVRDALAGAIGSAEAVVTADPLPVVMGDRTQLTQVLQNLVGNGLKFRRPETRPEVHVGAERVAVGWRFTVDDNGIGIAEENRERIFKPFTRLHGAEAYEGTGIGLAICRRVIESHGGEIHVEPSPLGGTRFSFTLAGDGPA